MQIIAQETSMSTDSRRVGHFRTRLLALLLLPIIAVSTLHAQDAGDAKREQVIGGMINILLERYHFSPQEFDSELAGPAFELYLERLDPAKQFLLAEDVERLQRRSHEMTRGFTSGDFSLVDDASRLLLDRVEEVGEFYGDILDEPFDFTVDEFVETNIDSIDYASDEDARRERWRKQLKYQTLLRYLSIVENEELDEDVFHPEAEEKAREQVAKNVERWLGRIEKTDREANLARYVNAVVNVFDPHTEYYPPLEKENFDINITGRLEGIGAQLREEDGYIKVVNIVPGSASWRGKELGEEDLILKVAQDGEEPVDVIGATIDDAVKLIRGPKGTKVTLTVKKPDGRIKPITITRDVVELEETYAKGAMIDHAKFGERYGYIDLPKFYTDFTRNDSPKAVDDIREILEDFADAGVEGVVLDLRGNGGGSMQEAIDIAGLFIEEGPVVQVQDRNGRRQVYSDTDNGRIAWTKGLVVLVDVFSASSSEILAGMLQDYDRAVVVGSTSTFGKGTVQRFYDLDEEVNRRFRDLGPLGSLKVTTQQFYRVNGASTQFDGVEPDVVLPNIYSERQIGERALGHALPGDTIDVARFKRWLDRDVPVDPIVTASRDRVAESATFGFIADRAAQVGDEQRRLSRPLNWRTMLEEQKKLDAQAEEYEASKPDLSYLSVTPLDADMVDEARLEALEEFADGIAEDVYIDEALSILRDLERIDREHGWTWRTDDRGSE